MKQSRDSILETVTSTLPFAADPAYKLDERTSLAELGVTSLHLVTMLLSLKKEYDLEPALVSELGLSTTISDLVTLVQKSRSRD